MLVYKLEWFCLGKDGDKNEALVNEILVKTLRDMETRLKEVFDVPATWILDKCNE